MGLYLGMACRGISGLEIDAGEQIVLRPGNNQFTIYLLYYTVNIYMIICSTQGELFISMRLGNKYILVSLQKAIFYWGSVVVLQQP